MVNEVEHLFFCLLVIWVSSFVWCLFIPLPIFLLGDLYFSWIAFHSLYCVLWWKKNFGFKLLNINSLGFFLFLCVCILKKHNFGIIKIFYYAFIEKFYYAFYTFTCMVLIQIKLILCIIEVRISVNFLLLCNKLP